MYIYIIYHISRICKHNAQDSGFFFVIPVIFIRIIRDCAMMNASVSLMEQSYQAQYVKLSQIPLEFNETLRHTLADHVTVYRDERIVFTFTDSANVMKIYEKGLSLADLILLA